MDLEQFTDRARGFIEAARNLAEARRHQYLIASHLVQVLLADRQGLAAGLMRAAGAEPERALAAAEEALGRLPRITGSGAGQLYASPEFCQLVEIARKCAREAGDSFVTAERLFEACLSGCHPHPLYVWCGDKWLGRRTKRGWMFCSGKTFRLGLTYLA